MKKLIALALVLIMSCCTCAFAVDANETFSIIDMLLSSETGIDYGVYELDDETLALVITGDGISPVYIIYSTAEETLLELDTRITFGQDADLEACGMLLGVSATYMLLTLSYQYDEAEGLDAIIESMLEMFDELSAIDNGEMPFNRNITTEIGEISLSVWMDGADYTIDFSVIPCF